MIEQTGIVTAVQGDHARVQTQRQSPCGGCSSQGACGTSLLDRFFGRRAVEVIALNRAGAAVGDRVLVGISEEWLLTAALATYLVPLLALLLGAIAGETLGGERAELASLLGAASGFLLALSWLRRYSVRAALDPDRQPVVVRRI